MIPMSSPKHEARTLASCFGLLLLVLALGFTFAGCQRVHRYPPAPLADTKEADKKNQPARADQVWVEPKAVLDVPLVFVPSTAAEWKALPAFWNPYPPAAAGMRTI